MAGAQGSAILAPPESSGNVAVLRPRGHNRLSLIQRSLMFQPDSLRPPMSALPSPLFEVARYAHEVEGAPAGIAILDVIATASAVIQCHFDLQTRYGRMPLSINTLAFARTGGGKGNSFRYIVEPVMALELLSPSPAGSGPNPLFTEGLTEAALMQRLFGVGRCVSVQLEDAGDFIEDFLMKTPQTVNKIWSGRATQGKETRHCPGQAKESRGNFGMRTQPLSFDPLLDLRHNRAVTTGLWPRCLVAYVRDDEEQPKQAAAKREQYKDPMPGYLDTLRSLHENAMPVEVKAPAIDDHATLSPAMRRASADVGSFLRELGIQPPAQPVLTKTPEPPYRRRPVQLSAEATDWVDGLSAWLRGAGGAEYTDVRDAASRAGENTERLATIFHIVSGASGDVAREMVERAWGIVRWSLTQHRIAFVERPVKVLKERSVDVRKRSRRAKEELIAEQMQDIVSAVSDLTRFRRTSFVRKSEVKTYSKLGATSFNAAYLRLKMCGFILEWRKSGVLVVGFSIVPSIPQACYEGLAAKVQASFGGDAAVAASQLPPYKRLGRP